MDRMGRSRSRRLAVAALALGLAGCAPHIVAPPNLETATVEQRYRAALERRLERAGIVDGTWSFWAHEEGRRDPPGVTARMVLESPDAFRVRVNGFLGVAIDAAGRGDSMVIDAPALKLSAVDDRVVSRAHEGTDLGSIVWRTLAGAWHPPAAAWERARAEDSLTVIGWLERGDSLELAVGASGLPREARLVDDGRALVIARYPRWGIWDGVPWPTRVTLSDGEDRYRLTCQASMLRLEPKRGRSAVRLKVPDGAMRLTGDRWKRLVRRIPYLAGSGAAPDSGDDSNEGRAP